MEADDSFFLDRENKLKYNSLCQRLMSPYKTWQQHSDRIIRKLRTLIHINGGNAASQQNIKYYHSNWKK
jgi:hypothetical protein